MTSVRQALRGILRRPGAAAATFVTLALAIAANAAVGSVLYGLLLAPLPFPAPDRLVTLDAEIGGEEGKLSAREVRALQQDSRVFEGVAAFYPSQYNMTGDGTPESVVTMIGTSTLFPVLGARAVVGEVWPASLDWTTQSTVLLTHGLWQRRFGGDPTIVGRSILLDNGPYTVVGVLPDGFDYPAGAQLYRAVSGFTAPDVRRFTVVARLRADMTMAAAQAELTALAARLAAEFPESNRQARFIVRPLRDVFVGRARPYLWLLAGAVGVALLLAVANVTNLRLARAIGMRGDLAVRAALGASRTRLVAAVAVEGLLLVVAAGVAGVFLSAAALRLVSLAPLALPAWLGTGLAWPVVAALAVLLLCVGGLVSLVPGWLMTRGDQHAAIVEGSRRAAGHRTIGRWQQSLVALQVAVAVVLVAGAGLLARSLSALDAVDPGFQPQRLLTFRVDPPSRPYSTVEPIALFYRRASEALRALPGVTAVGHNDTLPFGGRPDTTRTMTVEGRDAAPGGADQAFVNTQIVSPAYFATMGVPLVRGRGFTADDRPGTVAVAVVGERTARRFWGDGDPIGQRVRTTQRMSGSGVAADTSVVYEVVGVVADVRTRALDAPPAFDLYVSAEQVFSGDTFFVVRTTGDAGALATAVGAAVRSVDPNQSLFDIRTMRDRLTTASWQARTSVTVLTALALVGLVVAAVGTYGVLAYAVALREREFGVRAALGADAAGLRRFVFREGLRPVAIGLAAGLLVTMGVGRSLRAVLFEVAPADPGVLAAAVLALGVAAVVACLAPAWRASRTDPAVALRAD